MDHLLMNIYNSLTPFLSTLPTNSKEYKLITQLTTLIREHFTPG